MHYYGDIIRKLFMAAALTMALTLPFFAHIIPGPLAASIFAITVLAIVAGLTNPQHFWVSLLDAGVAILGVGIFEYYAVLSYQSGEWWFFLINQALTVLFVFAVYLSIKTVRGKI